MHGRCLVLHQILPCSCSPLAQHYFGFPEIVQQKVDGLKSMNVPPTAVALQCHLAGALGAVENLSPGYL